MWEPEGFSQAVPACEVNLCPVGTVLMARTETDEQRGTEAAREPMACLTKVSGVDMCLTRQGGALRISHKTWKRSCWPVQR